MFSYFAAENNKMASMIESDHLKSKGARRQDIGGG